MENKILLLGIRIEIWAFIISILSIILTLLRDFILPWFLKPKLKIQYKEEFPYRRENRPVDSSLNWRTFLKFSITNKGDKPALNCRCQILRIERDKKILEGYNGFPLKWANRPEYFSGERLNIGQGEVEFVDLAYIMNYPTIYISTYNDFPIDEEYKTLSSGEYDLFLILSGDNFQPYQLRFKISKENTNDFRNVKLNLIQVTRKIKK